MAVSVCAVIVTHDRADLLARCLGCLAAQTRPADHVVVVDNASADATPEVLAAHPEAEVLRLEENVGGSGGFHRGVEHAHHRGHDWLWLLDDDTLPDPGALAALLDGARRAPRRALVMASAVRWKDGRLHPMNRPWLRVGDRVEMAAAAGVALCPIRAATFVSVLVHRDAVTAHGLPPGRWFLWLDDIAFTARVLRAAAGYLAPESTVTHWTPHAYDTLTDSRGRFYFKARNHLWLLRGDSFGGLERLLYAGAYLRALRTYVRTSTDRGAARRTVLRGVRDGLRRDPG